MIIYYINYDGIDCSVFDSQIYTYCRLLSENNLKVTLINCDECEGTNISIDQYKDKMNIYSNNNNLKVISLKKNKKFATLNNNKLISEVINLIKEENLGSEKIIIHCRGPFGSYIGLKVRKKLKKSFNIKVISDFRGAVIDEYLLRHKDKNLIYKMLVRIMMIKTSMIQSYICRKSDYILCVSKKLEEYLKFRYITYSKVSIIPTCIDSSSCRFDLEARQSLRNELKIENKFVLTYCGGAQGYQNPKGLINAFINISEKMEDSLFLIITEGIEVFEALLNELNVDKSRYLIKSVHHNEVYKYLSAADCAILLRENNIVNKVASPTKFAEYINCNLPVFISHDIGDIDEISAKYNTCIYDTDIDNIRTKIHEININKENFNSLVQDHYEWNKSIKTIISIYNLL